MIELNPKQVLRLFDAYLSPVHGKPDYDEKELGFVVIAYRQTVNDISSS